ncbi:hypothetical protein SAMN05216315_13410 [Nitrosospira sp. Nsp18]|nr:hypothetical protein SAMN05216315_13410 [Nitrosospira sp. Nsp18]
MEWHVFARFIDDRGSDERLQLNEVSFLDFIYPTELFRMYYEIAAVGVVWFFLG